MINWILEHFTLPYVLVFVGGLLLGYAINWFKWSRKCKKLGKEVPRRDGFLTVVGVVIIVAMVWIMVSVGQARNCALQLNNTISIEQAISKQERDALRALIFSAVSPPPEIADLANDDPARIAWGRQLGAQYITTTQDAAQQREANQAAQDEARRACGT